MAKTLNSNEIELRNKWLKYFFFPATQDYVDSNIVKLSGDAPYARAISAAKIIFAAICKNEFVDIDSVFKVFDLMDVDSFKFTYQMTMDYIASVCQEKQIYWDDFNQSRFTVQEKMTFKNSEFGKALVAFECFVSQDPILVNTNSQQAAQSTGRTRSPNTGAPSGQGSRLYLNTASGLINQTKHNAAGSKVYWIKGLFNDPTAKTKPRAHVSPYQASSPLRVKYKSGQGFEDCLLFFNYSQDATIFKEKIEQNCKDPKVNNSAWEVKACSADSNGYFDVMTEFGPAMIEARKLHEMLEALEKADQEEFEALNNKISNMSEDEYNTYKEEVFEAWDRWN